jgi:hypothetical protein
MAVTFSWVVGIDKSWKELNRGADIKLPKIFKFILKYITPVYLIALLALWMYFTGWKTITLANLEVKEITFMWWKMTNKQFITGMRIFLLAILD